MVGIFPPHNNKDSKLGESWCNKGHSSLERLHTTFLLKPANPLIHNGLIVVIATFGRGVLISKIFLSLWKWENEEGNKNIIMNV